MILLRLVHLWLPRALQKQTKVFSGSNSSEERPVALAWASSSSFHTIDGQADHFGVWVSSLGRSDFGMLSSTKIQVRTDKVSIFVSFYFLQQSSNNQWSIHNEGFFATWLGGRKAFAAALAEIVQKEKMCNREWERKKTIVCAFNFYNCWFFKNCCSLI